jgi:hypothetical protein
MFVMQGDQAPRLRGHAKGGQSGKRRVVGNLKAHR